MSAERYESHHFNVLPYGGNDSVLVVVCDCGWCDTTDSHKLGGGWDVACAYAVHMGLPDPRDLAGQWLADRPSHSAQDRGAS